jgi:hypothetical protein
MHNIGLDVTCHLHSLPLGLTSLITLSTTTAVSLMAHDSAAKLRADLPSNEQFAKPRMTPLCLLE